MVIPTGQRPGWVRFLWRWNFAFALASNRVPTVTVALDQLAEAIGAVGGRVNDGLRPARLIPYFIGRAGSVAETTALDDYLRAQQDNNAGDANHRAELVALVPCVAGVSEVLSRMKISNRTSRRGFIRQLLLANETGCAGSRRAHAGLHLPSWRS